MGYITGLIGGLGLFIYGMQRMAEGLEKAAGDKLKRILEVLTSNSFVAMLTGIIVTVLVQSSSTSTVMVVGFVNAGLMNLIQAVGIIFGANIGTTITAQMVSFKLGKLALPAIGIGFATMFFAKKRVTKNIGQAILGFGILFLGMNIMSDTLKPLQYNESFRGFLAYFGTHPVLGVIVGALFTMAVQSSSAATGVIVALALEGLLDIRSAIVLVLGTNIGTCITALLASVGANVTARRAAFAHMVFNIIGSFIFLVFLTPFVNLVSMTAPATHVARQVANGHTIFNVFNALLFLPFIKQYVKLITWLVPGEDIVVERGLKFVDRRMLKTPSVALGAVEKEILRMANLAAQMVDNAAQAFKDNDSKLIQQVLREEEALDELERELTEFLAELSHVSPSREASRYITGLLHMLNDIERVGDHSENIIHLAQSKMDDDLPFSDKAIEELTLMHESVKKILADAIEAFNTKNIELAHQVVESDDVIDNLEKELRNHHIGRINERKCIPASGVIYLDVISNFERIADHATNIAQIAKGDF